MGHYRGAFQVCDPIHAGDRPHFQTGWPAAEANLLKAATGALTWCGVPSDWFHAETPVNADVAPTLQAVMDLIKVARGS